MIAEKELAIVRAALRYFCDEFEPHGNSFEDYLDGEGMDLLVDHSDLRATLAKFEEVVPLQVLLDSKSSRMTSRNHFACDDAAEVPTPARSIQYVTILLPRNFGF